MGPVGARGLLAIFGGEQKDRRSHSPTTAHGDHGDITYIDHIHGGAGPPRREISLHHEEQFEARAWRILFSRKSH